MNSVPSSVAASTSNSSGGNGHNSHNSLNSHNTVVAATVDVELDPITTDNSISDNVELQVSYSSNSAGILKIHMFQAYLNFFTVSTILQVILKQKHHLRHFC